MAVADAAGLVRAAGNGTATVTASAGNASNTAEITVAQKVSAIAVSPGMARLGAVGDTVRLVAAPTDANGYPVVDAAVDWRSDDASAVVIDSAGLARAVGQGTATVTASAENASGTAVITVAESPDRRALKALYDATAGADWTNGGNWLTSTPIGRWHGIEVDAVGRVIGLALGGNNLTGWIPPEVGDLDRLRYLHLDDNELNGPLPAELAGATDLTVLRINGNLLAGPLPPSLLSLSLEEFHYADTGLCVPPYETFRDWLGGIASHAGPDVECTPATDREILVQFYEATEGPNWKNRTNWLTGAPLGEWHGVTTDADGRVLALSLLSNGLKGVLPAALGGLSKLQRLTLVGSRLSGPIPPELGQLPELQVLRLSSNELVGVIPRGIGNASSLRVLGLANNQLRGAIPQELGWLTELEALYLELNNLSGTLHPELGNLSRLQYLKIDRNILLGPIPGSLLRLDELQSFTFDRNLGLCAPGTVRFVAWLGRLAETRGGYCNAGDAAVLERLHEATGGTAWTRSDGWLAGQPLSGWYGVVTDSLGYVRDLDLRENELFGTLPSELGDLAELNSLRIGGNALTGPLPFSFTQLPLREFGYSGTELCVPPDGGVREWLSTVSSHDGTGLECTARDDRSMLETLYRSLDGPNWKNRDGWLTDRPLDSWSGVRVDGDGRVIELALGSNNLAGRIPPEIGNLPRLRILNMSNNSIDGPIPPAIGRLSRLEGLNLDFNSIGGPIPAEIGKLSNLRYLHLAANSLPTRSWDRSRPKSAGSTGWRI